MTDDPVRRVERQDELLELLYWLEGERITGSSTLSVMARFITQPEQDVRETLGWLLDRGDVERTGDDEYRLTVTGRREAGRRFAEEFSGMLGQGHGECNDPSCDCHTNPAGAAECHAARAQKEHKH